MTAHPNKPTIPEVLPLACAVYKRCPVGCCLHIVLDDGNYENDCVQSCIGYAEAKGHKDCEELARLLLRMSTSQRRRIAARIGYNGEPLPKRRGKQQAGTHADAAAPLVQLPFILKNVRVGGVPQVQTRQLLPFSLGTPVTNRVSTRFAPRALFIFGLAPKTRDD